MKPNLEAQIEEAVSWLKNGEPVALPTETVYGLAAPFDNIEAVKKIFSIKQRPLKDPLIVHVTDIEQASKLAQINNQAEKLAEKFWPGPLTIVLKKLPIVPDLVTANMDSIAIRSPQHPLFRKVLEKIDVPLVAPSANPFAFLSPTQASHVKNSLKDKVKFVLDGDCCLWGIESTIVSLTEEQPQILRHGPISKHAIEETLQSKVKEYKNISQVLAPGMFKKHYSPKTPLLLVKNWERAVNWQKTQTNKKIACVFWSKNSQQEHKNIKFDLSLALTNSGELKEGAANLFNALQEIDPKNFDFILIEQAPTEDLGIAINERLYRATIESL